MYLEIILLLLGIPVGFLIANMTKDELVHGRKYFRILIILGIIGFIGFFLYGFSWVAWSFGFIGIVSLISFVKSYDKKWMRKK